MKATICPTERFPRTDWMPPAQMTMTMPIFTHIVRTGDMVETICSTRTDWPV